MKLAGFFKKSLYGILNKNRFPYTEAGIKRKFIFIHIPKSAGSSIRSIIGEPETGRRHLPWWVYARADKERFESYFKFAFVRDPVDRCYSAYSYLRRGGNQKEDVELSRQILKYYSFEEFIYSELIQRQLLLHNLFKPQVSYLCDWNGEIKIDFVGRYENLVEDFSEIANRLSIEGFSELSHLNASGNLPAMITPEAIGMINLIYKDDFFIFNYPKKSSV